MAHQMPVSQQTQYPGPIPQQHQNTGQQRHAPNGQQNFRQSMPEGSQTSISDTSQGAFLVSFILEKPRNATSWEDVVPEQQHVTAHDLKKEVHKFRRNHNSVKKALNEIASPNCRRIINELVEEQNVALAQHNPAMQYRIVSVINKFRERNSLTRRERQLVRVDVILEAEESGFQGAKMAVETASTGQDSNRVNQASGQPQLQPQSQINNHSQNRSMQQQMPQQRPQHQALHSMGPSPYPEPLRAQPPPNQGNSHVPMQGHIPQLPPPPPPLNAGMNGQTSMAGPPIPPPPPPPTAGGHHTMPRPHVHQPPLKHHSSQSMPGSYPEPMPVPGRRSSSLKDTVNHELSRSLGAKYKNHTDTPSVSSESDVNWEDESGGSSFIEIESATHEDMGGRERERGRHAKKSNKSPRRRVRSRSQRQSRSRSRGHPHRLVHGQNTQRPERRHRTNSNIDDERNLRRSPATSGSSSPQPLHTKLAGQAPANIHIHMNTNSTTEDRTRSGNASPVGSRNEKRKPEKVYTSHDEVSEGSWDRASGTESWNTASVHTAEDGTWDMPLRHYYMRTEHSQRKAPSAPRPNEIFGHQRQSYSHNSVDPRSPPRPQYHTGASNENIPTRSSMREREREPYYDEQQARTGFLQRRATTAVLPPTLQTNASNHTFAPPKPIRASSFAADSHESGYSPSHSRRNHHIDTEPRRSHHVDGEPRDEQINLRDLQVALEWVREKKEDENARSKRYSNDHMGSSRRRRDFSMYDDDEWAFDGGRRSGYERFGGNGMY